MVIKRVTSKRGQIAENTGVYVIIALLVLGVIAYAIYLAYSSSSQTLATVTPEELAALKAKCIGSTAIGGQLGSGTFYDFSAQKFSGKSGVANCCYDAVYGALKADPAYANIPDCTIASNKRDKVLAYCAKLGTSDYNNVIVNGFTCKAWGAPGKMCKDVLNPDGSPAGWKVSTECTSLKGTDVTNQVVNTVDDTTYVKGNVCCLPQATGTKVAGTSTAAGNKKENEVCSPDIANDCLSPLTCMVDNSGAEVKYTCQ